MRAAREAPRTFLLRAGRDCWLGDGIKNAAVLSRVVPVTDTLHLVTAGLQEREREREINIKSDSF